jgi:opacity protein-like surface antigen
MTNELEYQSIETENDINEFSFKPSLGWFVFDGFAIGLTIDYQSTREDDDTNEYKTSSFLIGPSIIYYFGDSNIKPFIQGEYMFGNNKQELNSDEEEIKMNGWGLSAGAAFFLNKNISLDLGLGYANISGEVEDIDIEQTTKGFSLYGGVSVYF